MPVNRSGRTTYKAVPFAKGTEMRNSAFDDAAEANLQGRPLREGD